MMTSLTTLAIFIIGGLLFVILGWGIGKIFRPHAPNIEKNSIYESGEAPSGSSRVAFNSRFLLIALIFLLFEIEILFLLPWAVVIEQPTEGTPSWIWSMVLCGEMLFFVGSLLLGLLFLWKKGLLDWEILPSAAPSSPPSKVPQKLYDQVGK